MLISDVLKVKGRAVVMVRPTDTVAVAVGKLADHHIGAVVVEDQRMKLVGIFSERDLVNAVARDAAAALRFEVQQLMSSPVIGCGSSDRVDAVLAAMTLAKIRDVPVIDGGTLNGIVSIGDLVKYRLDEQELKSGVLLDRLRIH